MPRTNAKQVLLSLVRCAGKDGWLGKTKLFKAFYFAHLFYAKEQPGILTDWPMARIPQGPGIHDARKLFRELMQDGLMTMEKVDEGPFTEFRFCLTDKGSANLALPEDASTAICRAAEFCRHQTA